jgi:RNA polymerase sigma-70 factor (ECF subfamily)
MSKTSGPPPATFDDVMAQADWVRRFALALCRDADEAADAAWEGLTRAWQHPPDGRGPLRPWLATVVRNLVRSDARARARSQARHVALGQISPTCADSPEDQIARWELWKELITLVEALDEPFRQTVMSRYFDGSSAAEIARRDGIPEATVRGRLKTGLDRLRRQLDERREGGRAAWVAVLLPSLPRAAPSPEGPGARDAPAEAHPGLLLALGAAVMVVAAIFLLITSWSSPRGRSTVAAPPSGGDIGATTGSLRSRPGLAAPAFSPGADGSAMKPETLPSCLVDLDGLREKRRVVDELLAKTSGPHSMYRAGRDNPAAADTLRPLIEAHMRDDAGHAIPFDLTCHDLACRIVSLWPVGTARSFRGARGMTYDLAIRTGPWEMTPGGPVHDAVTDDRLEKLNAYVGLQRQDGAPATAANLERSPAWFPVRSEAAVPRDLVGCVAERQALEHALKLETLIIEADREPSEPTPGSLPNPTLEAHLRPQLARMFEQAVGTIAFELTCHDRDCRLVVPAEFARRHRRWLRELRGGIFETEVAASTFTVGEAVGYLRILPPGFQLGTRWLSEQVQRRMDVAGGALAIAGCRPHHTIRGTVGVELSVTSGRLPDDSGSDDPIHYAQVGSLAGTSAGDCVMLVYRQLLGDVEVPPTLSEGSITFEHEWKD